MGPYQLAEPGKPSSYFLLLEGAIPAAVASPRFWLLAPLLSNGHIRT